MTCNTWHVACHTSRAVNILSKFQLPEDFLKIGRKRMNRLINDKAVCRTAPATPGLLIIWQKTSLFQNICYGNLELELGVLMLSCIVEGGHLHQLFHTVNLETYKYTLPCSVYSVLSSLTLGWNCTRFTLQSSSPRHWLRIGFRELYYKVHPVQFQLKSIFKSSKSSAERRGKLKQIWVRVGEVSLPPQSDLT